MSDSCLVELTCKHRGHVTVVSALQLRLLKVAPACTANVGGEQCGEDTLSVKHLFEPGPRYVGLDGSHWTTWADCTQWDVHGYLHSRCSNVCLRCGLDPVEGKHRFEQ